MNKTGRVFVAERNKEQALRILNLIMAVGTLRGIDLYAVREHELGEAQYNKEKKEVGGHSYALSSIRMMQSSLPGRSPYFGTEIDPKRLQEAIMEAEKLYPNLKAVEELRLFIESFTHFNDSEYAQSFVLSWSIIERHLYELWTKKLAEMDLDEDRQSKLLNTVQWSTDYLIEVLSLSADISDLEYEAYGELKKKRNRFIHS